MGRKWPFSEICSSVSQRKALEALFENGRMPGSLPAEMRAWASLALSYESSSQTTASQGANGF